MDEKNSWNKYEIYRKELISFLISIRYVLENIKIKKEWDPLTVTNDIDRITHYLEGLHIFPEKMKKELNIKYDKNNKEEVIRDLNIIKSKSINNEDTLNNIEEIISNVKYIYNILDHIKNEPQKPLWEYINNNLNHIEKLKNNLQNLDNILNELNNIKNKEYLNLNIIIYGINSLISELHDINLLIDYIKIDQIPNPDNFMNYIDLLVRYIKEIDNNLNNIKKLDTPESYDIYKKIEEILGNVYFNISNTTLNSIDKYFENLTNVTNGKYKKYRAILTDYFSKISNALINMIEIKNGKININKNIIEELRNYITYLYIFRKNIEKELDQKYNSIKELIEDLDNILENSSMNEVIRKVEEGIRYDKIIDAVIGIVGEIVSYK